MSRTPLREQLRRALRVLRGSELSPTRGGAAVALGLFVGSLPIFGLHTPLVLALCLWLRLDAVLAWAATNVSNPFVAPFLIAAELAVGASLRTGALVRPATAPGSLGAASIDLVVGAPIVGALLAGVGFAITWAALTVRRRRAARA